MKFTPWSQFYGNVRWRVLSWKFAGLLSMGMALAISQAAQAGSLTLSWNDNSDNEDGFRIERSADGTVFAEIALVAANVNTFADNSAVPGVSNSYRVRAYNTNGDSDYSNVASGMVPPVLPSNSPPSIMGPGDQSTFAGSPLGPLSVIVSDVETPAGELQVSVESSNTALIGATALELGGSGGARTLTIRPALGVTGTAQLTIGVSDGTHESSAVLQVTVLPPPVAPTIVQQPVSVVVGAGTSPVVSVSASGEGITYQWYEGESSDTSRPVTGATAPSLTVENASGARRLWVRISSGPSYVDSATVTVDTIATDRYYFGLLGDAGRVALLVRPDLTGTLMAWSPTLDIHVADVPLSFGGGGNFSITLPGAGLLHGTLAPDGVSGEFVELELSFLAQPQAASGAASNTAGFFEGVLIGTSDGVFSMLVEPAGDVLATLTVSGSQTGGTGIIAPDGTIELSLDNGGLANLDVSVDPSGAAGIYQFGQADFTISAWRQGEIRAAGLVNTSIRANTQTGDGEMIAGFSIGGTGTKRVLIRGAGPALLDFGLESTAEDPRLVIHQADGGATPIASNDDWNAQDNAVAIAAAADGLGAFPFLPGSRDAALLLELPAGSYTALVTNAGGAQGAAIAEIYDVVDQPAGEGSAYLSNISLRGRVGAQTGAPIAGFVVNGTGPKRVLIRAIGWELGAFGVTDVLRNPAVAVHRRQGDDDVEIVRNDDWNESDATLLELTTSVGAFPLVQGSRSAALVTWLEPGVYTAVVSDSGGTGGVVLLEVYEVR